jgi:hypothetical protein
MNRLLACNDDRNEKQKSHDAHDDDDGEDDDAEDEDDDEVEKEEKKSLYNTDEGEEVDSACEQGYMRLRATRVRLMSNRIWMLRQ